MTVKELFKKLGKDNICEVMYAKDMSVQEAEEDCAFSCTRYTDGFLRTFALLWVTDWKIAYVEDNKICIALAIQQD